MLKIQEIQFLTSYAGQGKPPVWNLPEIAVVGRSNVGKSSFINAITGRKAVAKISSKPGKTRLVNYFVVDADFILVDLPGYGYAKAAKTERDKWKKTIDKYFRASQWLKTVIIIIDSKVGVTELDQMMFDYCAKLGVTYFIIANKEDKLNQSMKSRRKKEFDALFGKGSYMFFSALKRRGVNKFLTLLKDFIE